ncbi:MAG: transposase [Candidatus Accumulibacter sp.]|nr:transposase [Accumulibacter sp.]
METLKATTLLAMLHWPGIKPYYSRPRVSDDNVYAEALVHTAKHRPEFPARGFENIDQGRLWGSDFVRWYNTEQRHSGIRHVAPEQRHAGDDEALPAARHSLFHEARAKHRAHWSRHTRNWSPVAAVTLNPERDGVVAAVTTSSKSMPMAA